jgi:hypothetical protein
VAIAAGVLNTFPSRLRKYPTAKSTPQWRDALSA